MYVPELHQAAIDINNAMTFGGAMSIAAGAGASVEVGAVYGPGPERCYGCYFTECVGGVTDVGVGASACAGLYRSLGDFPGQSTVTVESAGELIVFSTMQVFSLSAGLIGTESCLGLDVGLAPISAGGYSCSTVYDEAGCLDENGKWIEVTNNPPFASCSDVSTCADADTCVASTSINNGSYDPDGDSVLLTQAPPAPYSIGDRLVTLKVTDAVGAFDTCSAQVSVNDCTPPTLACPAPTVVECQSAGQAVVDPGNAVAADCSAVSVTDPGPASYPLGETTVTYTATDASFNSSSCDTTVTVVDTTPPDISCNARDIVPPDAPISFAGTASDACGEVGVEATGFDCYSYTKKGTRIDKTGSCMVAIDGNTVTIVDSGGVDTTINWTLVSTDGSGNSASEECSITVRHPVVGLIGSIFP